MATPYEKTPSTVPFLLDSPRASSGTKKQTMPCHSPSNSHLEAKACLTCCIWGWGTSLFLSLCSLCLHGLTADGVQNWVTANGDCQWGCSLRQFVAAGHACSDMQQLTAESMLLQCSRSTRLAPAKPCCDTDLNACLAASDMVAHCVLHMLQSSQRCGGITSHQHGQSLCRLSDCCLM